MTWDQAKSEFAQQYLASLWSESKFNVSAAARAAGMDRSNFRRLCKHHGFALKKPKNWEQPRPRGRKK